MRKLCTAAASAVLLSIPLAAAAADAPPTYSVAATIPLGGAERWDYVAYDAGGARAFVAHGTETTVVDLASKQVVGHIGPLPGGTHGIAFSRATGTGFTDDGKAGAAAVFDLKTLKILATVPTAPDADGIIFDPATGHVFVINGDSGSITVIDPKTNKAIATIDGGAGLEFGLSDGGGKLFVDGAEKNEMLAIDARTNKVLAHWPLTGCVRHRPPLHSCLRVGSPGDACPKRVNLSADFQGRR